MRGRPRKSDARRFAEGTGPAPPERPYSPPPMCPSWLDDDAKLEWARIVPELSKSTPLTEIDASTLAAYCQAYSTWKHAELRVRAEGMTFVDNKGNLKIHPLARICSSYLAELRRISQEFGFSPAAREKINTPPPAGQEEDDFGDFLRGISSETPDLSTTGMGVCEVRLDSSSVH